MTPKNSRINVSKGRKRAFIIVWTKPPAPAMNLQGAPGDGASRGEVRAAKRVKFDMSRNTVNTYESMVRGGGSRGRITFSAPETHASLESLFCSSSDEDVDDDAPTTVTVDVSTVSGGVNAKEEDTTTEQNIEVASHEELPSPSFPGGVVEDEDAGAGAAPSSAKGKGVSRRRTVDFQRMLKRTRSDVARIYGGLSEEVNTLEKLVGVLARHTATGSTAVPPNVLKRLLNLAKSASSSILARERKLDVFLRSSYVELDEFVAACTETAEAYDEALEERMAEEAASLRDGVSQLANKKDVVAPRAAYCERVITLEHLAGTRSLTSSVGCAPHLAEKPSLAASAASAPRTRVEMLRTALRKTPSAVAPYLLFNPFHLCTLSPWGDVKRMVERPKKVTKTTAAKHLVNQTTETMKKSSRRRATALRPAAKAKEAAAAAKKV